MTDKVTLTDLANLQNESTAVSAINANNAAITTAMDNTLSRDGTSPNSMGANLDMNSNRILNLAAPTSSNEPARLQDLTAVTSSGTITINNVPTGGSANAILRKASSTDFDMAWTTGRLSLASGKLLTISNTLTIAGTDATTLTFQGTDTYVGRATTDTLSNKTISGATLVGNTTASNLTSVGVVQASNNIIVSSATGKIGYTTGAGGSISQATNGTTAVTLNTACGIVTLFANSLAAATAYSFNIVSSVITALDIVAACPSGLNALATLGLTTTLIPSAGSIAVVIRNSTAASILSTGSLQYAIIKAVQS